MKKLLSLYVFAVLSLSAFAQTDTVAGYKSIFGHESTVWNGAKEYWDDPHWFNYILQTSYDTIIDSLNYKKIDCYRYIISTNSWGRCPESEFFLREDTITGKVWVRYETDNNNFNMADTDYLVVDMTLEIGDSILLQRAATSRLWGEMFYVRNISYSGSGKTIHLQDVIDDFKLPTRDIYFIEGVGCSHLFDFAIDYIYRTILVCCHKDGELIYHNAIPNYPDEDCIVPYGGAGIDNCDDKVSVSVFPNPCTDWIEVNGENIQSASLCDIKGNVVMADIEVPSRISMADIPSGVYFLRVVQDNMVSSRSVIKK